MQRWFLLAWLACGLGQASDVGRPPLIFREDWTASPPSIPLTQQDVASPGLAVAVHGQGPPLVKKSFHDARPWDPHYVWSGLAGTPWAVSLSLADGGLMDLRGTATVRWRSRQSGFRSLRAVVELEDGRWLVSEQADGASDQWRVSEFAPSSSRWRRLDIATVTESAWEDQPDLGRVRSVGFTDLMPGGRSAACSRLDWIEVYGQRLPEGPMQVFLLSGQSNMVGWGSSTDLESAARFGHDARLRIFEDGSWRPLRPLGEPSRAQRERWGITERTFGPEIGFAHALAAARPGSRVGIVKQAVAGTGIMAWSPDWSAQDAAITGDEGKGPLYRQLLNKARAALRTGDTRLKGFLWLQGGKDMRDLRAAKRYEQNLRELVEALRRDLGAPKLPLLLAMPRQNGLPDELDGVDPDAYPAENLRVGTWEVLRAQVRAARSIPRTAAVILRDLPRHPGNIHANSEGMLLAGREFARVYLQHFGGDR